MGAPISQGGAQMLTPGVKELKKFCGPGQNGLGGYFHMTLV